MRITSKGPIRILAAPRVAPLIITTPGPVPYSSEKDVLWNYRAEVYYHGVTQEPWIIEDEEPEITNIARTSKTTRTGRIFSPEISLSAVTAPVHITTTTTETRGV